MDIFFFFNDTATTEIYTLSLHDALPIFVWGLETGRIEGALTSRLSRTRLWDGEPFLATTRDEVLERSEEHTSELQSRQYLVCRLLLEKKKKISMSKSTDNVCTCVHQTAT